MSNLKYRPEIDGLRALSVLAVVLFHLGVPGANGGFVGVDVFFVISGFLITSILRADLDNGTFSLLSFYDRRIRRILPALLVMLSASIAAGYWLLAPGDYATMARSAVAAATSVSNVFFWLNTGYFDASSSMMPLLHTWSLAIEEQFYVFLPLLLAGIYHYGLGRRTLAILLCFLGLSFIGALIVLAVAPKAAFYLPQYRAWELAAGAVLAFLPEPKSARFAAPLGLILIGATVLSLNKSTPFPGTAALLPVVGAALVLRYGSQPGAVRAFLSVPPVVFVGKISYSFYLWHWPVIVFWKHYTGNASMAPTEQLALAALSFALGWLSWRWIEQPLRRRNLDEHRTVGTGIGASVLISAAALVVVFAQGFPARISPDLGNLGNRDAMWTWSCPADVPDGPWKGLCQVGSSWTTARARLVLTGDSHAEHFMPYIHEAAKANNVAVVLFRACPPVFTTAGTKREARGAPSYTADCTRTRTQLLSGLAESPDVAGVIIASAWSGHALWSFRGDSPPKNIGTTDARQSGLRALQDGTNDLLDELKELGKQAIIVADMPSFDGDPLHCAIGSSSGLLRWPCAPGSTMIAAAVFNEWQAASQRMLETVRASHPEARFIFPGPAMCSNTGCDATQDGKFLYRDTDHLRRDLDPMVNRQLADRIGLTTELASPCLRSKSCAAPK